MASEQSSATLTASIADLKRQDAAKDKRQSELEALGVVAEEPQQSEQAVSRVKKFMNGFRGPVVPGLAMRHELWEIRADREGIRGAISEQTVLLQQAILAENEAAAEAATPRWLDLIRRDAAWAAEGKRLYDALTAERGKPYFMWLPHIDLGFGNRDILGVNWSSDPASRATHELIARGVLTGSDLLRKDGSK
jgi:hypothetical protein